MRYLYWEKCLVRTDHAAAQLRRNECYEYMHASPKLMDFHYVMVHASG